MNKYVVLFEKLATGYGASAPDLPGCVTTGATLQEARARMAKAMEMHLSAMREDGDPIPEPSSFELLEAKQQRPKLPAKGPGLTYRRSRL